MESFSASAPPPAYDLHNFNKTASTIQLTTNEITQSKEKLREKNAERDGPLQTSDFGALLHVVKSSLGSGFLAMPYAFHNIGLLMGFMGTVLVAIVCTHCTYIVVKCSQELCYQQGKVSMSYTETVESAFKYGARGRFNKWSKFMMYVSDFFMFITYYGVNTVYVILIATSFKQVLENHLDYSMNIRWYALILLLVLLPIGIIRHIKFLVPFSALANVFLLVGCSLTLYFCFVDMPPLSSRPLVVEVTRWPLFFSTALFGMEGIGTVMPVENTMRYPRHFLGCPGVLNLGMAVVASVFLVMGAIGYINMVLQVMPVENAMRYPRHFLGCPGVLNLGMAVVASVFLVMGAIGYINMVLQVMPVENAMRYPRHFLGCPGVLNLGMTVVASVFLVMGAIGYINMVLQVMPVENAMRYPRHFLGCPGVLNLGMTVVASVFLVMGAIGYINMVLQVMPVENAMRYPRHFLGCPGVLNLGMTVVASVFLVMGAIGYINMVLQVMPVENAMRYPRHFLGCPGVLNLGMTVVASVFLVMGAIGYIKYGDAVQGNVTLNLPQDALSEVVKILIALAILLTYPLQLAASMEVVWQRASLCFSEKEQDKGYYIVRVLMIVGTVVIGIAVPNLSPVLSLVGAIGFSGLGLLLPTVTELVTYWDVISKPFGLTVIKNAVIIVIWAFATVFGTITSLKEIVEEYNISA